MGDLSAKIDWGYAGEYMEAAWQLLQQPEAGDYILATGEAHSVEEFVQEAFNVVGLNPAGYLESNPAFMRPTKTSTLIGDTTKAQKAFGFSPKIRFKELVEMMVKADLEMEEST